MAAVGILLMTVIIAFAVINLPNRYPAEYHKAYIRVPKPWLILLAIITAVTNLPFVILVMLSYKHTGLIFGLLIGLTLLFTIYYFMRVNWLKRKGVNWKERTMAITGDEE